MSKKELKTNAMRMLERQKIPYEYKTYECEEFVSGIFTADQTGLPHELVYNCLLYTSHLRQEAVFWIFWMNAL